MFGISGMEFILIAVFALVIFGPDKIPDIARTAGKAIRTFKRTQEDMERLIKVEMYAADPDKETSPFAPKDPFAASTITAAAAEKAKASKSASVASELYAVTDEDEEEEDEE